MKAILSALLLLSSCLPSLAQQSQPASNLLLGYQEFPTTIVSHTSDGSGGQYYTGYFRGQLKVNNQVLATGKGLEDIFLVKTNTAGQVQRFKTFGTSNSEFIGINSLAFGGGRLLLSFSTLETIQLETITLTPYNIPTGSFATAVVCTDTAGTVKWVRKTNLQHLRLYFFDNVFHLIGQISHTSPATKWDDDKVLDSLGRHGIVHLMLDTSGNFLQAKSVTARKYPQSINFAGMNRFSDKSLLLQLRAGGDSAFFVQQTPVALPTGVTNYELFMRTDTGYHNFRVKNINPQRHVIGGLAGQAPPMCVAGDSIYQIVSDESSGTLYQLDGFSTAPFVNNLFVFDSTLTLRRRVTLSNSKPGFHPNNVIRRRLLFRKILVQNGMLYANGVYTGANESPFQNIPTRDTVIQVLPGVQATVNQNGPSRSFMALCNVDNAQGGSVNWYGDHREYENFNVSPLFLHAGSGNYLVFSQNVDNVWNPWIFDGSLNIVSGSMKKNADLSETTQMIGFFPDGSRIILGNARGKTAFDSNENFLSHPGRSDAFVARLLPNNQVAWYKRFHSTLTFAQARGLQVRNGKAYFLFNYNGTQNDSNYIRVEQNIYSVGFNASILGSLDTAGTLTLLNLNNPLLRTVSLTNFGFFGNGDLAVTTSINPVKYASFPLSFGPQIFRMNPGTGTVLEGRKLVGGSVGIYSVHADQSDQLYLSGSVYAPTPQKISLHDGTAFVDSVSIVGSTQQSALIKMGWNRLHWAKSFTGGFLRQLGDMVLQGEKPVFGIGSSPNSPPLVWDGQTIHNGLAPQAFTLVSIRPDGTLAHKKILSNFTCAYMRTGANNRVYISGMMRSAMAVDTIQLGFVGGTVDGLGLVFDSTLTAKQSFRIGSPYNETLNDMHIYNDSLVALAYTSQTNPQVFLNRTSVDAADYEEDAYVGTFVAKASVTTGIATPLPAGTFVSVAPNPVTTRQLHVNITATEPLRSTCTVYRSNGQIALTTTVSLVPGTGRYTVLLPATLGKGLYHVVLQNKKWRVSRSFLVL